MLKWKPGQDLSLHIISAIHFQGNPLGGGYSTAYVCSEDWVVHGARRPIGGGCVGVLYTRLAAAVGGGALGRPKNRFRVSLLDRILLRSIRFQFNSTALPAS